MFELQQSLHWWFTASIDVSDLPSPMYQHFYGLQEMPFHITPNPRFLFLSATHEEALQHLRYGIQERKGFIALSGEVGCGKTTLCRKLMEELDASNYDTALIVNPRLSETQLLKSILTELNETTKARSKNDLVNAINAVLLQRIQQGREIVLIVDEAQNLSFEVLEQLRLLSNLETDEQKLLQIILMGQPELKEMLMQDRLRQLRQRILVFYELRKLSAKDTRDYIQHRLTLAGANGKPQFTPRALKKIHKKTGGTPRLINNLCDKSMLAAFIRQSETVNWWDVRKAAKDISRIEQ